MELNITDLSRGGAGVGRGADGQVVFVPFTAPGDRVSASILDSEKRYAQGQLVEVIAPGAERVEARCPVFGRCGGCEWQHLPYERQWSTKVSGVKHALARAQIKTPADVQEFSAEKVWEYRNRIQLRGEGATLGFYARGTHDLVSIDRCEIARPEINAALARIRAKGAALELPYKVEVEVTPGGKVRESWNSGHAAGGFRQVHDDQNEKLRAWVSSALTSGNSLLDLFGGSGNLSLPLAGRMKEIHCVDVNSSAPVAREQLPENYHFHRGVVLNWLLRSRGIIAPKAGAAWSAIIDPPREGLGREAKEIASGLEKWGANEVVLVGCDPDSWARDLSRFLQRGWKLDRLGVVDLFPQTHHVESLALIRL